jgi:hypothetical protein
MALKYRRKRHEAPLHRTLADSMIANSRSDNAGIFFVSCCSTRHEHLIFFRAHKGVPTTECCRHRRLGTDDLPHGIPHRVLYLASNRKVRPHEATFRPFARTSLQAGSTNTGPAERGARA